MKSLAVLPLLASCALMATPHGPVPIDSVPSGAVVLFEGKQVGTTPCVVPLERQRHPILTLRLDGYHDQRVMIEHPTVGPAAVVDLLLLIPAFVDVACGVDYCIDPTPLLVELVPTNLPAPKVWRRLDYEPDAKGINRSMR